MRMLLRSCAMSLMAALAACGPSGEQRARDTAAAAGADTTAAGGMQGMQGMGGMHDMPGMGGQMGGRMMEDMQSHMQMMMGASADSMKAMLSMHRQMVANMISQMNREMRQMNMTGDASWTTTLDSLRQDLVRMPEMSAAELKSFMPSHRARVMRLMEMHRKMMTDMTK